LETSTAIVVLLLCEWKNSWNCKYFPVNEEFCQAILRSDGFLLKMYIVHEIKGWQDIDAKRQCII